MTFTLLQTDGSLRCIEDIAHSASAINIAEFVDDNEIEFSHQLNLSRQTQKLSLSPGKKPLERLNFHKVTR